MYKQGSQMHQSKSHEDLEAEYEENLSLLSINKQAYSLPVSSSNVADRSYQQYLLQPTEYQNVSPATSANVIFNTGNLNVNGPNSVLQCSIKFANGGADPPANLCWSFGNNDPAGGQVQSGASLANIVREALIQSRSGAMIQRNTYANVLAAAKAPFEKGVQQGFITAESGGASWMAQPSPFQNAGNNYGGFVYPIYSCSSEVFFELPLSKVLSFFGTNAPLCGVILSGAKLTLNFESMLTAFVFYQCTTPSNAGGSPPEGPFRLVNPLVTTPATGQGEAPAFPELLGAPNLSYNIRNAQLMLDTTQIFDSSSALIMAAASSLESSALQYPFWGTYQTRTTLNTSSNTIDIMISAAKLKTVIVVFRSQADINTGMKDSFARLPLVNYTGLEDGTSIFKGGNSAVGQLGVDGSLRLRLGSQLNTLTPIRNAGQLYRQTYNALTTVKAASNVCDIDPVYAEGRDVAVGVSYSDWYYKTGATTIAFDMSRSPIVSVSGGASNNSKAILLEIVNCAATVQAPVVVDVFCELLCCLNSSTENSVLDS
jgi:hypothetical protein